MLKCKRFYVAGLLKQLGPLFVAAITSSLVSVAVVKELPLSRTPHSALRFRPTQLLSLWFTTNDFAEASTPSNSTITISPDGTNIQSAIDALPLSGGVVELAPGTYTFSSPIYVRSNLTIEGPRSAILTPTGNFGAFQNSGAVSNLTFRGFTLTASGISLSNADYVTVQGVEFLNTGSTAISFQDPSTHIQILDNQCENPATYFCIALGSSPSPNPQDYDWIIRGNMMTNCATNCILVLSGSHIIIAENVVNGCGDTCIEMGTGTSQGVITGNIVDSITSTSTVPIVGISTRSSQYDVVVGNSVSGNSNDVNGVCYLAWHGSVPGETQEERYYAYLANISANCQTGFQSTNTNHFIIGGFDFENNSNPALIDRAASSFVALPSMGIRPVGLPGDKLSPHR